MQTFTIVTPHNRRTYHASTVIETLSQVGDETRDGRWGKPATGQPLRYPMAMYTNDTLCATCELLVYNVGQAAPPSPTVTKLRSAVERGNSVETIRQHIMRWMAT